MAASDEETTDATPSDSAVPSNERPQLRDWLSENKIYFETVAALSLSVMALVISIVQIRQGSAQNQIANALAENANQLTASQNALLVRQIELDDNDRRARRDEMLPIFTDIDREARANESPDTPLKLSPTLQARITLLSHNLQPYRSHLGQGILADRELSPERGYLLEVLILSRCLVSGYGKFEYAVVPDKGPTWTGAKLQGVRLSSSVITNKFIRDSNLAGVVLDNATLNGCRFQDVLFRNANLAGASFRNCTLPAPPNFENARVHQADFTDAIVYDGWLNELQSLPRPPQGFDFDSWSETNSGDGKVRLTRRTP